MTYKLYSIKDVKVGFEPPFMRINDQVAIREFNSAAKFAEGNNRFRETPEDFELWCVGEIDTVTGVIISKVEFVSNLQGVV